MAIAAPLASDRSADRPAARSHPRRHRRRHRLCRTGTGAHPGAPSGGHADGGDVVGGDQHAAAAAGAGAHLGRRGRAARRRPAGRATPTSSSWRCRKRPPPSWRRSCSSAACGSSTCPARSGFATTADRQRWYPATAALAGGHGLRASRAAPGGDQAGAPGVESRLLSDRGAAGARAAGGRRPAATARSSSTRSRASRARARRRSDRTHFSENHGSVAAYGVFSHRHTAEIEQELGTPVTFVPHLVPLDRGILETIYASLDAGHDRGAGRRRAAARVRGCAVRAADRRRAAGNQARRAHQLLRHRLEGGRRGRAASCWSPCSTTSSRAPPVRRCRTSTSCSASTSGRGCCERAPKQAGLVLKLGGELLEQPQDLARVAAGDRGARAAQRALVVVHGGGKEIDAALATAGIPSSRSTACASPTRATLDVVVAVLAGAINTRLVAAVRRAGGKPVGLTGADASVATVKRAAPIVERGRRSRWTSDWSARRSATGRRSC